MILLFLIVLIFETIYFQKEALFFPTKNTYCSTKLYAKCVFYLFKMYDYFLQTKIYQINQILNLNSSIS